MKKLYIFFCVFFIQNIYTMYFLKEKLNSHCSTQTKTVLCKRLYTTKNNHSLPEIIKNHNELISTIYIYNQIIFFNKKDILQKNTPFFNVPSSYILRNKILENLMKQNDLIKKYNKEHSQDKYIIIAPKRTSCKNGIDYPCIKTVNRKKD